MKKSGLWQQLATNKHSGHFNMPKEVLFNANYCEAGPRWNATAFRSHSTNESLAMMMMAAMMMITPGFKLYNH
jgi:hypothetical protein